MKKSRSITLLAFLLAIGLVQLACNFPSAVSRTEFPAASETPGESLTPTVTLPPIVTATAGTMPTSTQAPTAAQSAPTATTSSAGTGNSSSGNGTCSYKVTFVNDVTVPDDSTIPAGSTFVKTWLVRNDGTCTWGPSGYALHALAFTGGSQMGAPAVIPLHTTVQPGQTVDVSVTLTAPTTAGTYSSQWMFRVDNDPAGRGPNIGLGPNADQPLYTRIKVSSALTRLNFASGATAIVVNGSIGANETKGYVLAAQKDQVILALLSSAAQDIKIKITASDNTVLKGSPDLGGTSAMAALPSTQDYIVWVTGGSQSATFSLSITIPSRITFAPGEISASVNGKVSGHMQVSYILRAQAGQTMTVNLTGSDVGLTIYGLTDGQPLVRAESGAKSWTGKLPATQDYILVAVPAVDSTTFTLQVTVQ